MKKDGMTGWLDMGRVLYTSLVRETSDFHKAMESMDEEGVRGFVGRRQEMLERIQKFDADLDAAMKSRKSELNPEEKRKVEEFGRLREALVRKAMETDGAIILHAKKEMGALKGRLDKIAHGRRVIRNYRGERLGRGDRFDLSA